MGMCFGVRDAIALTRTIQNPADVTIHGELVHNEQVNQELADQGFASHGEVGRTIPATPAVMITAHGVSNHERNKLRDAGKQIIDTTCPLVRRAHDTALQAESEGWHVVIAGKRGHVEVVGLTGDLADFSIVESPTDARLLPHPRIGIVCQTTLQPTAAEAIAEAMRAANPDSEVRLFNTVCRPTRERQSAMKELLDQCDAVVVVGGPRSNNTLQLVRLAQAAGTPAVRVNSPAEINEEWVSEFDVIGLTAGTSTPDSIIDAVHERLLAFGSGNHKASVPQPPASPPHIPAGHVPSSTWVQWFEWNALNQAELPWEGGAAATREELEPIVDSLQEFQRGESSDGRHFLTRGFHHAMQTGDADYLVALNLFIAEENRHGSYLARFLEAAGAPLVEATPADSLFRALRRIGGLEGAICVLLTAEIIACTYYTAIHNATTSPLLRGICRQILQDEYKHLRFQNERLRFIGSKRPWLAKYLILKLQALLLAAAIPVLWPRHGRAIKAGGYTLLSFFRDTFTVFQSQIADEPDPAPALFPLDKATSLTADSMPAAIATRGFAK